MTRGRRLHSRTSRSQRVATVVAPRRSAMAITQASAVPRRRSPWVSISSATRPGPPGSMGSNAGAPRQLCRPSCRPGRRSRRPRAGERSAAVWRSRRRPRSVRDPGLYGSRQQPGDRSRGRLRRVPGDFAVFELPLGLGSVRRPWEAVGEGRGLIDPGGAARREAPSERTNSLSSSDPTGSLLANGRE